MININHILTDLPLCMGGGVPRGMKKNSETIEVCLTGNNASFGGYTPST